MEMRAGARGMRGAPRRLAVVAAIAALAVTAGCGGGGASTDSSTAAAPPAGSTGAATTTPVTSDTSTAAAPPAGSTGAATTKPVTLTVWDWGSPVPEAMDAIDKAYMAAHPNVTIKRVHQPFDNFFTLLRTAVATKKGPDVVENYASPAVFDFANGLLKLGSYRTEQQQKDLVGWSYVSSSLSDTGTPYAVPWTGQGIVFYYNKALFAKAGLDPATPPQTWDEFVAACEALKQAGIVPISAGWKDGYYGEWWIDTISSALMSDSELQTVGSKPDWTSPAVQKSLELLVGLSDKGYMTPNAEGIALFPDAINDFGAEKGAMVLALAANSANWSEFAKDKVGPNLGTMLPPVPPGSTWPESKFDYGPGLSWAITSWSENPDTAYDFLAFQGEPAAQEGVFRDSGSFPNNTQANPTTTDPVAGELLGWVRTKPTYLGIATLMRATVEGTLVKVIPQILTHKMSIPDAMKLVQATADKSPPIPDN